MKIPLRVLQVFWLLLLLGFVPSLLLAQGLGEGELEIESIRRLEMFTSENASSFRTAPFAVASMRMASDGSSVIVSSGLFESLNLPPQELALCPGTGSVCPVHDPSASNGGTITTPYFLYRFPFLDNRFQSTPGNIMTLTQGSFSLPVDKDETSVTNAADELPQTVMVGPQYEGFTVDGTTNSALGLLERGYWSQVFEVFEDGDSGLIATNSELIPGGQRMALFRFYPTAE